MKILKAMKKVKKFWSRKKKRKLMPQDHSSYYTHPPPPPPYPPPPPPPCFCHFCQLPPPCPVEPSAPPLPEEEEHLLISSQQELIMILETTQPQPLCHQQCEYPGPALMPRTQPPGRESRVFGFFVRCFLPCFGIEDEREKQL